MRREDLHSVVTIVANALLIVALILQMKGYIGEATLLNIVAAIMVVLVTIILMKLYPTVAGLVARMLRPSLILIRTVKGDVIIERACKICRHPKRAEIEQMLLEGRQYKEVIESFGGAFSPAAISRHMQNHMAKAILEPEKINRLYEQHRVRQIDLTEELFKLLDRLGELYAKLERLDAMFFAEERSISPRDYVSSVAERKNILEQIRETLVTIDSLKSEVKTERDLSELLRRLAARV